MTTKIPAHRQFSVLNMPSMASINRVSHSTHWYDAVSTFSGCGGASVGIKLSQGRVLWASEFIPNAARCYAANAPHTHLDARDVRTVRPEEILETIRMRRSELDLFEGSPPCKAYSSASRHNKIGKRADERVLYSEGVWQRVDDLFEHHLRLVRGVMPKVMTIENVPGLTESTSRGFFVELCAMIERLGYVLECRLINPNLLGVPQRRVRLVFLGIRKDLHRAGLRHAWPVPYRSPPLTVADVVPEAVYIGQGKGLWLDSRNPSPTLTVTAGRGDEFSGLSAPPFYKDRHGDAIQYSIPQLKRLFSFPDDFLLGGKYFSRYERLARAHAPLAVYNITHAIMKELKTFEREGSSYRPSELCSPSARGAG